MKKHHYYLVLILILGALVLNACGSAAGNSTPTTTPFSVEAIYTAAAQTVISQLTQQAPTITPTLEFTNTLAVTATSLIPQPTKTSVPPTSSSCANMVYVSDVTIPDGTQLPVGQEFTKTWRVQNTGTCQWTTNFKLTFSYGEQMGGQAVALASPVATGQQVDISVKLKVPSKSGTLKGFWVLLDDKGQHFGQILTVVINIGAVSPSPTGSVTVTPTFTPGGATSTPTATNTLPADTQTPSETPTATP